MAAADMFLMLDGIKGESADDKHKGEIDIGSPSPGGWRSSGAGHQRHRAPERARSMCTISISPRSIDKSSPTMQLVLRQRRKHIARGQDQRCARPAVTIRSIT